MVGTEKSKPVYFNKMERGDGTIEDIVIRPRVVVHVECGHVSTSSIVCRQKLFHDGPHDGDLARACRRSV